MLGRAVVRDEHCTIAYLLRLEVTRHHAALAALAADATQEEALAAMLGRVKAAWGKAEFEARGCPHPPPPAPTPTDDVLTPLCRDL